MWILPSVNDDKECVGVNLSTAQRMEIAYAKHDNDKDRLALYAVFDSLPIQTIKGDNPAWVPLIEIAYVSIDDHLKLHQVVDEIYDAMGRGVAVMTMAKR